MNRSYGWRPDIPDHRDHAFLRGAMRLPKAVDLRSAMPPVLDQGNLGSCTANAIANCHRFVQVKEGHKDPFSPSRLFIYYNERSIEGTVKQDAGAEIRDGFKTIAKDGVCPEPAWKYDIAKFAKRPTQHCYSMAVLHTALEYQRLDSQQLQDLKACLAAGYPFVFGFTVYESFESTAVARSGVVPMPSKTEQVLGGHAVLACGYDDVSGRFLVQNSWGPRWGQKGFFTIRYEYLTNTDLADDFWTLRLTK